MQRFDEVELRERLDQFPPERRVAFAAACCERLLPLYQAFHTVDRWGDPGPFRLALDRVWAVAANGQWLSERAARELNDSGEPFVPDLDDVQTPLASSAVDAAAAVYAAVLCAVAGESGEAAACGGYVAEAARGAVLFTLALSQPRTLEEIPVIDSIDEMVWRSTVARARKEQLIQQDPRYADTLCRQAADLAALDPSVAVTAESLGRLRQSCAAWGVQFADDVARVAAEVAKLPPLE